MGGGAKMKMVRRTSNYTFLDDFIKRDYGEIMSVMMIK